MDKLRSTTAPKIISSLQELFSRYGIPESLIMTSDNSPRFISAEFAKYFDNQGIKRQRTTEEWRGRAPKFVNTKENLNRTC